MNKFFAAAGFSAMLTSATPVTATEPGVPTYAPGVVKHATVLTRALAQRIKFNEGQYVQIKALHLRMLAERRRLEDGLVEAPAAERDNWLATAQLRYESELAALLHPEQRIAYQQLRSSFTAHRIK